MRTSSHSFCFILNTTRGGESNNRPQEVDVVTFKRKSIIHISLPLAKQAGFYSKLASAF